MLGDQKGPVAVEKGGMGSTTVAANRKRMLETKGENSTVASGVRYRRGILSRFLAQWRALPSGLYEKLVW